MVNILKTKLENEINKTMEARHWCLELFETAKKIAKEKEELEGDVAQLKSNIKQYMDIVEKNKVGRTLPYRKIEDKKNVGCSDSSGIRTIPLGKLASVKCYVITRLEGLPHVMTDFGIYQVDQEFLDTENVLILNKD